MKLRKTIGEKARERFINLFDKLLKSERGDIFSEYSGIDSFILDYEKGVYLIAGRNIDFIAEYMPKEGKFKAKHWKKCCDNP